MTDDVIELRHAPLDPVEVAVVCEAVVCCLTSLLVVTKRFPSGLAVCELLAGVPDSVDGLEALVKRPDGSLLSRTLVAVCQLGDGGCQAAVGDGLRRLVYMPPERRELVAAAIRGVFLGFSTAR